MAVDVLTQAQGKGRGAIPCGVRNRIYGLVVFREEARVRRTIPSQVVVGIRKSQRDAGLPLRIAQFAEDLPDLRRRVLTPAVLPKPVAREIPAQAFGIGAAVLERAAPSSERAAIDRK